VLVQAFPQQLPAGVQVAITQLQACPRHPAQAPQQQQQKRQQYSKNNVL
jgi:hypothetical protein